MMKGGGGVGGVGSGARAGEAVGGVIGDGAVGAGGWAIEIIDVRQLIQLQLGSRRRIRQQSWLAEGSLPASHEGVAGWTNPFPVVGLWEGEGVGGYCHRRIKGWWREVRLGWGGWGLDNRQMQVRLRRRQRPVRCVHVYEWRNPEGAT